MWKQLTWLFRSLSVFMNLVKAQVSVSRDGSDKPPCQSSWLWLHAEAAAEQSPHGLFLPPIWWGKHCTTGTDQNQLHTTENTFKPRDEVSYRATFSPTPQTLSLSISKCTIIVWKSCYWKRLFGPVRWCLGLLPSPAVAAPPPHVPYKRPTWAHSSPPTQTYQGHYIPTWSSLIIIS